MPRVRKAGDWVTQLSSQNISTEVLDIQYLYGCQCGVMPLKSCHWFLIRNPGGKEFWICSQCGQKFHISHFPLFFVVKTQQEAPMVFKCPQGGLPAQLENEIRMLQMTHIVSRLSSPDPNAVTTAEILNAIAHIAEAASERMNQYLPVIHEAFHNWPQGMLVCEDEKSFASWL